MKSSSNFLRACGTVEKVLSLSLSISLHRLLKEGPVCLKFILERCYPSLKGLLPLGKENTWKTRCTLFKGMLCASQGSAYFCFKVMIHFIQRNVALFVGECCMEVCHNFQKGMPYAFK